MHTGLDRGILGRQAVGIEADREKDIVALQAALAADNLQTGVSLDMADVHTVAGRIREFDQRIELRLAAAVLGAEGAVGIPVILPFLFDRGSIVFLHSCGTLTF